MSFILDLQRKQASGGLTPTPPRPRPTYAGEPTGLAATLRTPGQYSAPIGSQFSFVDSPLARFQQDRNYRG